jgi:hypothetical protein
MFGAALAYLPDFCERHLAREYHASGPEPVPELDRREIHHVRLYRDMHGQVGKVIAGDHDESRVGHDEPVGLKLGHGIEVAQVARHLRVTRYRVDGEIDLFAARAHEFDRLAEVVQAKLVLARAQRIARHTAIDGVGPVFNRDAQFVRAAGRHEEFWCFHGWR